MVEVIRIPKLGLSDYGDLISWEIDIGESVEAEETIAILESEKATAEIKSSRAGVLLDTYVEEGEEIAIEVGKPIAVVGDEGESAPSLEEINSESGESEESYTDESTPTTAQEEETTTPTAEVKATPRAKRRAQEEDVDLNAIEGTGPKGAITENDLEQYLKDDHQDQSSQKVKATPRAKRRAGEEDVDLNAIKGTGPKGAITEDDLEQYLSTEKSEVDDASEGSNEVTVSQSRELSGIRKTVADRLSQSAQEKPHVTGTREVSIEQLERVNNRLNEKYDIEVSLNDLLLHLIGKVLEDLPEFNGYFEDRTHKLIDETNIGYAVDGPRGLVVPVIDEVTDRSLVELSETRRSLVKRVINDEFEPADLQGGTFTVTNVGVFDMDVSYSIINPPEVAILAIGRRKYAPVERGGDVDFEKVITFSLTIDHRVLDGADSGAFLNQLAEYIKYPGLVLDDV